MDTGHNSSWAVRRSHSRQHRRML